MSESEKRQLEDTVEELVSLIKVLIAQYKRLEVETKLNPLKDLGLDHPVYRLYKPAVWGDRKLIRAVFVNSKYKVIRNNSNDKVLVKEWAQSVEKVTALAVRIHPSAVYIRGFVMDESMGVAYFKV